MSKQNESLSPHTLDNLCIEDKNKLIEMIRQLREGKNKCSSLEFEIENLQNQNEKLRNREATMKKQLEDMEKKVFEAVDISKAADEKVQSLTSELQKSEYNRKTVRDRYRESQGEITALKDAIHDLKEKYDKICVDTECQTKVNYCTRTTNTLDTALRLEDTDIQCDLGEEMERSRPKMFYYSVSQATVDQGSISSWNDSPSCEEVDEDLTRLIMSLN